MVKFMIPLEILKLFNSALVFFEDLSNFTNVNGILFSSHHNDMYHFTFPYQSCYKPYARVPNMSISFCIVHEFHIFAPGNQARQNILSFCSVL